MAPRGYVASRTGLSKRRMVVVSLAGHTYFACARIGGARKLGARARERGRGKNTYGVKGQVLCVNAGMLAAPIRLQLEQSAN